MGEGVETLEIFVRGYDYSQVDSGNCDRDRSSVGHRGNAEAERDLREAIWENGEGDQGPAAISRTHPRRLAAPTPERKES